MIMGSINVITDHEELLADRSQAAEMLTVQLTDYKECENLIVLGIPRGGVILADKLARNLNAELDIVLTRKIKAPHNPELAIGAVCEDGKHYLKESIVNTFGLSQQYIDKEKNDQLGQIKQRKNPF